MKICKVGHRQGGKHYEAGKIYPDNEVPKGNPHFETIKDKKGKEVKRDGNSD